MAFQGRQATRGGRQPSAATPFRPFFIRGRGFRGRAPQRQSPFPRFSNPFKYKFNNQHCVVAYTISLQVCFQIISNSADPKYSSDRLFKILSAGLAKDYSRPMGLTGNPGLSVGALINFNTTSSADIPQIDSSRTEGSGSGSPGIIRQAGCPSDLRKRYCRFHKFFVCGTQEGWRKPLGCKFETSQPISGVRTLQNGRYSHVERPSKTGRLSGQDRSQGCIFDRSNLERSSKVFTFSMERNIARVCLPSVWASHSTQGFTKLMKPVVAMLR